MVQLRIVLDTRRQKADGTFPLVYRITDVKKVWYIPSGISINQEHWDSNLREIIKTHPNTQILNTKLSKKYYEIQKAILKTEDDPMGFSFDALKKVLNPSLQKAPLPIISFYDFAQKLIAELFKINRTGNGSYNETYSHTFFINRLCCIMLSCFDLRRCRKCILGRTWYRER